MEYIMQLLPNLPVLSAFILGALFTAYLFRNGNHGLKTSNESLLEANKDLRTDIDRLKTDMHSMKKEIESFRREAMDNALLASKIQKDVMGSQEQLSMLVDTIVEIRENVSATHSAGAAISKMEDVLSRHGIRLQEIEDKMLTLARSYYEEPV